MIWYYWLIIAIAILFVLWLVRRFFNGPSYTVSKDMKGKLIIITGASNGIGKEAAFDLLRKSAKVIFACRDEKKTMNVSLLLKNLMSSIQIGKLTFLSTMQDL